MEAIEIRSFPALSYDRGSPSRFTEIRGEDYNGEWSRRAESRLLAAVLPLHGNQPSRCPVNRHFPKEGIQNMDSASNSLVTLQDYKVMSRESISSFND